MKKLPIVIGVLILMVVVVMLTFVRTTEELHDVRIGAILELTGPLAPQGERSKRGMDLALVEINSVGGISGKRMTLIVEDTKTDPKEGVAAFRKMVEIHNVPVVTGAVGSSVVMACAPIANEKKVVLFSAGATSPLITNAGDYVFRNRVSGEAEVRAMADFAVNKLKVKRLAVIYVNTDYGAGNKEVFEKAFGGHGGQILLSEGFDQGESDFRTYISKIRSLHPQAVYIIAHSIETAYFLKQAEELGLDTRFLSTIGVKSPDLWRIADDAGNGVIYTVQKFDPNASERSTAFTNKYREEYGEAPDLFAALGYDAIHILAKVIEERGYAAEAIKNGLYDLSNFYGVVGKISFDQNGDVESEITMEITKDGKFVPYMQE